MDPDAERMQAIAAPLTTVAARIRALDAAGFARADIARFLGKRYQHVRNVLEDDAQRAGGGYVVGRADLSGLRDEGQPFDQAQGDDVQACGGGAYRLVVRPDGSVMLPPQAAETLRASPGSVLMARLDGEEFNIVSAETALAEAREIFRRYVPADVDVVDRFLDWRRKAWERERG